MQIKWVAEPGMRPYENIVTINYTVHTNNKIHEVSSETIETYIMRYFFKPELELFLMGAGMELVEYFGWLTQKEAGFDTWNTVVIARPVNYLAILIW